MSRIGKKPVALTSCVTATIDGSTMTVKGPKGTLSMPLMDDLVSYKVEDGQIAVQPITQAQRNRAAWGMQRTNVQNLVTGVTEGFSKVLEITGVGYRAQAQGKTLKLQLGYSHDVNVAVPEGLEVKTPDNTTVIRSHNRITHTPSALASLARCILTSRNDGSTAITASRTCGASVIGSPPRTCTSI